MEVKKTFKNRTLYIDDDMRVEYKKDCIYFIDCRKHQVIWKCCIETSFFIHFLSRFSLFERLLRSEPRYVLRWSESAFLVSHRGCMYKVEPRNKIVELLFRYAAGTNNPLHFCKYERNGEKEIVFGDYGGHDAEGRVGVYRYTDDGLTEVASFGREQIDHIHRVEYDFYRDCYWVFTGDTDEGSGIWRIDYGKSEVVPYLVGKQKYRACVAFVEEEKIVYATDTPFEQNYIYSVNISDKIIERLYEIPGPCIYGTGIKKNDDIVYCFSTSVEPDSSLPAYLYKVTYKLGLGVKDRFSYVIIGNKCKEFEIVWRAKKDALPMCLFQFGNHRFPSQKLDGEVYFCPQSCTRVNGTWKCSV